MIFVWYGLHIVLLFKQLMRVGWISFYCKNAKNDRRFTFILRICIGVEWITRFKIYWVFTTSECRRMMKHSRNSADTQTAGGALVTEQQNWILALRCRMRLAKMAIRKQSNWLESKKYWYGWSPWSNWAYIQLNCSVRLCPTLDGLIPVLKNMLSFHCMQLSENAWRP